MHAVRLSRNQSGHLGSGTVLWEKRQTEQEGRGKTGAKSVEGEIKGWVARGAQVFGVIQKFLGSFLEFSPQGYRVTPKSLAAFVN